MSVNLSKGQKISLDKEAGTSLTRITMGLGWDSVKTKGFLGFGSKTEAVDLDASCVLFDDSNKVSDIVWFRQLKSKDGSIVHTGDNRTGAGDGDDETIAVDLSRLPASVTALVFTVNSFTGDTFDRIANAYCRLVDATTGRETARYDLTGVGSHTGQVMAQIVRTGGGWEMKALGERTSGRTFHDMMPQITAAL